MVMRGLQLLWHPTIDSLHTVIVTVTLIVIILRFQVSTHIHLRFIKGLMVSQQILSLMLMLMLMLMLVLIHMARIVPHGHSRPLT